MAALADGASTTDAPPGAAGAAVDAAARRRQRRRGVDAAGARARTRRDRPVVAAGRRRRRSTGSSGRACAPDGFATHVVPGILAAPRSDHLPVPAALLRSSLLMRYTRRVTDGFDVISARTTKPTTDAAAFNTCTIRPTCGRDRTSICAGITLGPLLDGYYGWPIASPDSRSPG